MWNNRIIKHEGSTGEVWYNVHEVFYNDNGGVTAYTENPVTIFGETVEEVKSQLEMIMKDIEKHEVIDGSTVELEDWDEAIKIVEEDIEDEENVGRRRGRRS